MQISRKNFPDFKKVGFFADIFKQITYIKFHRKPPIEKCTFAFGQTDGLSNSLTK